VKRERGDQFWCSSSNAIKRRREEGRGKKLAIEFHPLIGVLGFGE